MSDREEWPAWARQNEAPVAVMDEYTMWRRPDGNGFVTAIYADGTVARHPAYRPVECQTAEYVRQVIASLDFPGSDYERFSWGLALRRANARRETLPAPTREREEA